MKIYHIIVLFIAFIFLASCSKSDEEPMEEIIQPRIETFTFQSDGVDTKGKIHLPASYATNNNLPAVYLIDFQEQHFDVVTDEFDQVIKGVNQVPNVDALVVTLEAHMDIDATPGDVQKYYNIFRDMAAYVDSKYTNNTSRTFIGRGSEGGVVLMTMLEEDSATSIFDNFVVTDSSGPFVYAVKVKFQNDDFPINISNKRLHFSFSSTNDFATSTGLIQVIEEKQYPWLVFESIEYPMDIFETAYKHAFAAGLKFVLQQ